MTRIALLGATRRGHLFLERLHLLAPDAELLVYSFREDPWEPPYLDSIRDLAKSVGARFAETKQPARGRAWEVWNEEPVDLLFAVNWRYILPHEIYGRTRLGSFVFHDSLLPAYRGFSPTVWAIINGEDRTGVTLCEMDEDVDAGDIVDQERVPIGEDETIASVTERVTGAYLLVLERNLDRLLKGAAEGRPQDHSKATYTCRRRPEDNQIHWEASSKAIYDLIRAVGAPYPGAFTTLDGRVLRVWAARRVGVERRYVGSVPGRVVEVRSREGTVVLTRDGILLLTQVQLEGGPVVCAAEVLDSPNQTLGR